MGSQSIDSRMHGPLANNRPDELFADLRTPYASPTADATKNDTFFDFRGDQPLVKDCLDPAGNRDGPNVPTFSIEIDDCPMLILLLKVTQGETRQFGPPETAPQQEGKDGIVPLVSERTAAGNR